MEVTRITRRFYFRSLRLSALVYLERSIIWGSINRQLPAASGVASRAWFRTGPRGRRGQRASRRRPFRHLVAARPRRLRAGEGGRRGLAASAQLGA